MLAVSITLLLLSLPLTQSDACVWEFQWSEMKTPNNNNITCLPTNLDCSLYFNDNMIIYNADSVNHTIYRVNSPQAYNDCDVTSLYTDLDGNTLPPVNVPKGAFTMFNVNRDRLDLTALSQPYLISEVIGETCFKMSFSVGGDHKRNCSVTRTCISCVTTTTPPSTTPTSTTPTSTTTLMSSLTGVQIGLLSACCILFCFVLAVVVVLIVVVVYIMFRVCSKGDVCSEGDDLSYELKSEKKGKTWKT